jgi:hypothetical protein
MIVVRLFYNGQSRFRILVTSAARNRKRLACWFHLEPWRDTCKRAACGQGDKFEVVEFLKILHFIRLQLEKVIVRCHHSGLD